MKRRRKEPTDVVFVGDALKASAKNLIPELKSEACSSTFWICLVCFMAVPMVYYVGTALIFSLAPKLLWSLFFTACV